MEDAALLDLAGRLCASVGLPAPTQLARLAGGKNNRVYRVSLAEGPDVVLKSYFHDPRDTRNRLKAEWDFLTHAWSVGSREIPRPLASDPAEHAALLSLLAGDKLAPDKVSTAHVDAASNFIYAVNRSTSLYAPTMALASEACLSLDQHIAAIDKRVARLSVIAEDAPHRAAAEALVADRLKPAWTSVRARIEAGAADAGIALDAQIPAREVIISPSDFGFHNALMGPDGVLRFLDFEYAGLDDLAKLCGDFYACPEIPTPQDTFERFLDRLVRLLEFSEEARIRARLLRDAYRIKWTCIILNDFLPMDAARRAFAVADDRAERCARQLDKAAAKLDEIGA